MRRAMSDDSVGRTLAEADDGRKLREVAGKLFFEWRASHLDQLRDPSPTRRSRVADVAQLVPLTDGWVSDEQLADAIEVLTRKSALTRDRSAEWPLRGGCSPLGVVGDFHPPA